MKDAPIREALKAQDDGTTEFRDKAMAAGFSFRRKA
jgi:hypothetical protein